MLSENKPALERYLRFRLPSRADADDALQETLLAAYRGYGGLTDTAKFKAWLIGIARHKADDCFRTMARRMELPLEEAMRAVPCQSRFGITDSSPVPETLDALGGSDKQILYLYYFQNLPQADIAERLHVPLGTVKSRLHTAKRRFKALYPDQPRTKGENDMKQLPRTMLDYTIEWLKQPPFPVVWEEMMGWFIVPKLNETCAWAMYDFPERKRTEYTEMTVIGRASVHGIEGVEITAVEHDPFENNRTDGGAPVHRRFVAQLTDTHCRILLESHEQGGVKHIYTFLDGDAFLDNWGFGEDNCGNELRIAPKGDITRSGSVVTTLDKRFLLDVVGRCAVTIGGKRYDTICVMDVETYSAGGVVTEQFLDAHGRTILWRRFNRDDWAIDRYHKRWSEALPNNERLTVNGKLYVHWYDCITDYIL